MSACPMVKSAPYQDTLEGTKSRIGLQHGYIYIEIVSKKELS